MYEGFRLSRTSGRRLVFGHGVDASRDMMTHNTTMISKQAALIFSAGCSYVDSLRHLLYQDAVSNLLINSESLLRALSYCCYGEKIFAALTSRSERKIVRQQTNSGS